jgi:acetolactate synthase-1/2/3 large subunit
MGNKKYSVADAVVNALIAEKVEFVFGLVGSHILPIYNALADAPQIRHINTKHEGNAAFMAGMVGHLTGRPGVVLVTAGPGAVNSLTGVAQAYASSYPMVHISGTVPTGSGNEAFHGVDQADFLHKMFLDITKWSVRVERGEDLPAVLSRAFALAVSGRPGPVHVDIPMDVVLQEIEEVPAYQISTIMKTNPSRESVDRVRQALADAKNPMICAGRGVLIHRGEQRLLELAEAIEAPVLTTTFAHGVIPRDHPLYVGSFNDWNATPIGWELLEEADLLLVIGMRTNTFMTKRLRKRAKGDVIVVSFDQPEELQLTGENDQIFPADSQLFLSALLDHHGEFSRPQNDGLRRRINDAFSALEKGLTSLADEMIYTVPMHPCLVTRHLGEQLRDDALVFSGVGNHNSWSSLMLPIRQRDSFIAEGAWGTMGSELPAGIAAKLLYPDRQVVVVIGDGSFLMAASDFVTAVQEQCNILVVVYNDSRYGMINFMQHMDHGRSFGDRIAETNYAALAESFSAVGLRVEHPDDLPQMMEQARKASAHNVVLLDVVCDYRYGWPDVPAIIRSGE